MKNDPVVVASAGKSMTMCTYMCVICMYVFFEAGADMYLCVFNVCILLWLGQACVYVCMCTVMDGK